MGEEVDRLDLFHFPLGLVPPHRVVPFIKAPVLIHDRLQPVRLLLQLIRVVINGFKRGLFVCRESAFHLLDLDPEAMEPHVFKNAPRLRKLVVAVAFLVLFRVNQPRFLIVFEERLGYPKVISETPNPVFLEYSHLSLLSPIRHREAGGSSCFNCDSVLFSAAARVSRQERPFFQVKRLLFSYFYPFGVTTPMV